MEVATDRGLEVRGAFVHPFPSLKRDTCYSLLPAPASHNLAPGHLSSLSLSLWGNSCFCRGRDCQQRRGVLVGR